MKIQICGPSGAGKTTLAKFISKEFNLPYVRTKGEELRAKYHCSSHADIIRMSATHPERGYNFQKELLIQRLNLVDGNESLVMDRSLVDSVTYFLLQNSPYCTGNTTYHFIAQALAAMPKFTHLIMIPPFYDKPEEDGVRLQNPHYQQMTWAMMEYVAKKYFKVGEGNIIKAKVITTYGFKEREEEILSYFRDNLI